MDYSIIFSSDIFSLGVITLLIFIARILDVSLGTIRIIFITKGKKFLALVLGFIETMIWLFAIGQILMNFTNIIYYLAYAGGFAMGNYVGIYLEEKLAVGIVVVQIITVKDATNLIDNLVSEGYGITGIDAYGATGKAKLIFTMIKRKKLKKVINIIHRNNPNAFYSIEDVRAISEEILPVQKTPKTKFMSFLRYKQR